MSAIAGPQITLEQAKQLVDLLEQGQQEQADELLMQIAVVEQKELFEEVGKLTRQLHESLKNFQLDEQLFSLTQESLPDAKQRLNYVMEMTEEAANKTMDAVEASLPVADKLSSDIADIKPKWDKLMTRNINLGEFKSLCHEVNDFMGHTQQSSEQLIGLLTEVLMAQGFQDLTGQVIRRIIELVREVEISLINLLTVFGTPVEGTIDLKEQKEESNTKLDERAEGPIIDAETRDDVVSGQDEVDDLLSSLGF